MTAIIKPDRLFVPLATDPYRWFESGAKTWELRALKGKCNAKNIRVGRRVELRRGYSTPDSLWGAIADVIEANCIRSFFDSVPWQSVICAAGIGERRYAEQKAAEILGIDQDRTQVIGFRVELETYPGGQGGSLPCPKCNEVGS